MGARSQGFVRSRVSGGVLARMASRGPILFAGRGAEGGGGVGDFAEVSHGREGGGDVVQVGAAEGGDRGAVQVRAPDACGEGGVRVVVGQCRLQCLLQFRHVCPPGFAAYSYRSAGELRQAEG